MSIKIYLPNKYADIKQDGDTLRETQISEFCRYETDI